jgi:phage terminase large subunit-like protein
VSVAYLEDVDPATFDHFDYLAAATAGLDRSLVFTTPEGRRALTKHDPLAFALVYLRRHLSSPETGDRLTLSAFHVAICQAALSWRDRGGPKDDRHAWVAPRSAGKSTWGFLVLPLWALAHGWRTFVIAFADAGPQAGKHLLSLKHELDNNVLLRQDFPDLCRAAVRPSTGGTVADREGIYIAASGAVFIAKGIDSSTLGAKIENRRPDLILLDDIEPEASMYSAFQARKRLGTILDGVFPLNIYAIVWFLGTTVMAGSIIHDLVRQVTDKDPPAWPREENIRVHYFPAIITRDDGTEESLWPALWTLAFLISIRHTASYAKNYANDPRGNDGVYWVQSDFRYGTLDTITRTGLWVDPAVTTKSTSDFTGLAVVSFSPIERKCVIRAAVGVRLAGKELRLKAISLLEEFPEIRRIFVEVNQGGDLWVNDVFHNMAVRVVAHTVSVSKEVRFAQALASWQRGRVLHEERLDMLETQAVGFPNGQHDDVIDAAVAGVLHFLHPTPKVKAGVQSESYV